MRAAPRLEDNGQVQQPSVIEEAASHEIYASLLGIRRRVAPPLLEATGAALIESEDDENDTSQEKAQPTTSLIQSLKKSEETVMSSLRLDKSNKGFEMLSKMGWKESEGGLGRDRQGPMLPIKTVFKSDKKGLGVGKPKPARVTHSQAPAKDDTPKQETKAERKRRQRSEREREECRNKKIRMMLRTDISDEYEQLYMKLR